VGNGSILLISHLGSISLNSARFYAAQLVNAPNYMHTRGIIQRNFKPKNALNAHMCLKIADFSTGKVVKLGAVLSKMFVGTA
jgi:3-phosphoinositide dependent protein kinase-1